MANKAKSADHLLTSFSPDIAAAAERLADDILRAAGSGLKHYTDYTRRRILAVAMDAYEGAYRAGANRVLRTLPGGEDA